MDPPTTCDNRAAAARLHGLCRYDAGPIFRVSRVRSHNLGSAFTTPSGQSRKRLSRGAGPRQKPAPRLCRQGFPAGHGVALVMRGQVFDSPGRQHFLPDPSLTAS